MPRSEAVEVDRPTWRPTDLGPELDDVEGLSGEPSDSTCTATECCSLSPAPIGWTVSAREDTYGRETEGVAWVIPWRLPDGRLVCEDCAVAYDEGTTL